MPKTLAHSSYRQLFTDIVSLYENARKSLALFYWKTGQRIVEVEQDGAVKAAYGAALLQKLSDDLLLECGPGSGFSKRNLERMRRFYVINQKTTAPSQLTWSHYIELMPVKDPRLRARLERRAVDEGLGSRDLRQLVVEAQASGGLSENPPVKSLPALKSPKDLKLRTCQKAAGKLEAALKSLITPERFSRGSVILDCGFFVCRAVSQDEAAQVTVTDKPSYTYAAALERVVDGDTLAVVIDLGFGVVVREKLRLRGINTPELGTPAGEKARKFVAALLPVGTPIILKTHKTDIYGRFVADVLYKEGAQTPEEILDGGTYLNQELLDKSLAVRMAG